MTLISCPEQVQAGEYALHMGPGAGLVMQAPIAEQPSEILNAHIKPAAQSASVLQGPPPASPAEVHAPVWATGLDA